MGTLVVIGGLIVSLFLAIRNMITKSKRIGKLEAENEVIEEVRKANLARTRYNRDGKFNDRVREAFKRK